MAGYRDPTFEQAYINLEREKKEKARLNDPRRITRKSRRIKRIIERINRNRISHYE